MTPLAWIAVGVLAGGGTVALLARLMPGREALNVLIAVVAMNAIYVGASLSAPLDILLTETAIALAVCLAALFLYTRRSRWIAATVLIHAAIDGAHFWTGTAHIPDWYIWLCLGFDLPFAAIAWFVLGRNSR